MGFRWDCLINWFCAINDHYCFFYDNGDLLILFLCLKDFQVLASTYCLFVGDFWMSQPLRQQSSFSPEGPWGWSTCPFNPVNSK